MIECHGCGALHALIDRLTTAVEALEAHSPTQNQPDNETETRLDHHANPDGVPETNTEEK